MSKADVPIESLRNQWINEANAMTTDRLPAFIDKLVAHEHGYDTIIAAIIAAAIGAAKGVNRAGGFSISAFQAGCVVWGFIQEWLQLKGPLGLVVYSEMLDPEHEHKFNRELTAGAFKWLQQEAEELLKGPAALPEARRHWESIVAGEAPFGFTVEAEDDQPDKG